MQKEGKEVMYYRCGSKIMNPDGSVKLYDSITKAKRASREIQQKAGGLGLGSLRVVAALPKTA